MASPKIKVNFGGRQGCLALHFCLLALLQYFLVPLLYYSHLPQKVSLLALSGYTRAGPLTIGSPPAGPLPSHDGNNCPICLAASSWQDYGLSSSPRGPAAAPLAEFLSGSDPPASFSLFQMLVSVPRGPPPPLALPIFRTPTVA